MHLLPKFGKTINPQALLEQANRQTEILFYALKPVSRLYRHQVKTLYLSRVVDNLKQKLDLPGFILSQDQIRRTVIGYESFKLEKYVKSGVFPKRYFGYFDLQYDTAPMNGRYEKPPLVQRGSSISIRKNTMAVFVSMMPRFP